MKIEKIAEKTGIPHIRSRKNGQSRAKNIAKIPFSTAVSPYPGGLLAEAIAIRYGPHKMPGVAAPDPRPIVTFTDSNTTFAGRLDGILPPRPGSLREGGPARHDIPRHPAYGSGPRKEGGLPHQVVHTGLIYDTSNSMNFPAGGRATGSRHHLAHTEFNKFASRYSVLFENSDLCLIEFNARAKATHCANLDDLQTRVMRADHHGGTNFEKALKCAYREAHAFGPESRKVAFFLGDGDERSGDSAKALAYARGLQKLNCGCFLIGVGVDYKQPKLMQLAQHFGFSGWAHTPMPSPDQNVFEIWLPRFMHGISAAEHYLTVSATGDLADSFGITPTIKHGLDGKVYIGYQLFGATVFLETHDNVSLELIEGRFAADKDVSRREIEIVDADDNDPRVYEQQRIGYGIVQYLRLFLNQIHPDPHTLRELLELGLGDKFDAQVSRLLDMFAPERNSDPSLDEASRRESMERLYETASDLGEKVNQFSMVDPHWSLLNPPRSEEATGDEPGANLFSGSLGPLDQPLTGRSLPPIPKRPDPRVYDTLRSQPAPRMKAVSPAGLADLPLDTQPWGTTWTAGRRPGNDRYVLNANEASRDHFEIHRSENGRDFFLADLGSRNGTYLNGVKIEPRVRIKLNRGDLISACDFVWVFENKTAR